MKREREGGALTVEDAPQTEGGSVMLARLGPKGGKRGELAISHEELRWLCLVAGPALLAAHPTLGRGEARPGAAEG